MSHPIRRLFNSLALLLCSVGLFLSVWIVIPAPTLRLLPLGVGAPEVSPWLLVLNAIAFGSVRLMSSGAKRHHRWLYRLGLFASLLGLFWSALPLLQLPATAQRMATAMVEGLGADYKGTIASEVRRLRSQPFILTEVFTGIKLGKVRYIPNIQFAAPDNVPLSLDIYQPPKPGIYPALVVIYGGGWQNGDPTKNASFNRYMAERGYTVFAIDYRHAPRYQFPAQLEDVQAALTFIHQNATKYEADPKRLALLGRSAGGHLAMLAAYQPDALPIQAVVSYYGPFNLTSGYKEPPYPDPLNVRAVLEAFLGGTPDELPEQYAKASPASYVTRPLPPTLLVHGSRDHIVEVRFARNMYNRLGATGTTRVLLEIPWAEHAFDAIFNGLSNQLALYYTERFLDWALKGV